MVFKTEDFSKHFLLDSYDSFTHNFPSFSMFSSILCLKQMSFCDSLNLLLTPRSARPPTARKICFPTFHMANIQHTKVSASASKFQNGVSQRVNTKLKTVDSNFFFFSSYECKLSWETKFDCKY